MNARPCLRLVPSPSPSPVRDAPCEASDLALLGALVSIHAIPLVALAAGHPWGRATLGYATAVTLVAGRELARELARSWRAHRGSAR